MTKLIHLITLIFLSTVFRYVLAGLDPSSTPKPNASSSTPVDFYPASSSDIYSDLRALNNTLQVTNFHVRNQKLNSSSDAVVRFLKLLHEINNKIPELQKTFNKVDKEREMDKIRDNYSSESNLLQNSNISNSSSGILILCVGVVVVLAVSLVIVWFFV